MPSCSRIPRLAETTVEIADHRPVPTIVLGTNPGQRFGILTHALWPEESPLGDWHVMTTSAVLAAMRLKQRVENHNVRRHRRHAGAIPTRQAHIRTLTEKYDLSKRQSLLLRTRHQVSHYKADMERCQTALGAGRLSRREEHTLYPLRATVNSYDKKLLSNPSPMTLL